MSSKNYEILDPNDILLIINIFLLSSHQDIYLIQSQLHVLFFRFYNFNSHDFSIFMVKSL